MSQALGLRQGAVVVRDYDSRWPVEYELERAILADLLKDVVERIEHIGSTAVPGLNAKPMVDIAISFADRTLLDEGRACLLAAGYNDRGDLGEQGGVVVTKGPESDRTIFSTSCSRSRTSGAGSLRFAMLSGPTRCYARSTRS